MFTRLALSILLAAAPIAASAQGIPLPVISDALESPDGTQLTINGTGFGTATPQVSLAGTRLTVTGASNTSITAALPPGTAPGAYLLIVTNGATHLFGALTAAIGPVQGPAGPQGTPGAPGLPGPIGPQGATGPAGLPGAAGATGAAGAIGPIGPTGLTGAIGPVGPAGPVGAVGPIGPVGPVGAAGVAGPQGVMGAAGTPGAIGPVGPAGAAGQTGPQGSKGATGPTGMTGPRGDPGPAWTNRPEGRYGGNGSHRCSRNHSCEPGWRFPACSIQVGTTAITSPMLSIAR